MKGIEAHPETFAALANNLLSYQKKHVYGDGEIQLFHEYAQDYQFQSEDTFFYFFNPFGLTIMKSVIFKLIRRYETSRKERYLIFYYPERRLVDFLDSISDLSLFQRLIFDRNDSRSQCLIYHLGKEEDYDTH